MLKLKDVIEYFDPLNDCKIEVVWKANEYDDEIKPEEIYNGSVLNIPWYLLGYFLYNDFRHSNYNAIEACKDEDGKVYFYITLLEY